MKLPFTIYDLRHRLPSRARDTDFVACSRKRSLSEFTIWRKSAAPAVANHQSSIINHKFRHGVALIITLILLSVVTFMAITFLALSRRERSAVSTVTDTASARLAADAALANAEGQIMANALSTTNPYNFGLLVSTNYINPNGFVSGSSSFTNVNYLYANTGNPVYANPIPADFLQLLTNLWYSPRPPVFVPTNSAGSNDFRFYLDLNRNGRYDTNGWVANVDNNNHSLGPDVLQVGDPEWIGVLQRPDQPYGPNNPFVARYAFIAVPVGNTLDLNAIHNQAQQGISGLPGVTVNPSQTGNEDNFDRNEGVGSWEINLAAFLTDLNTNEWDNKITGLYQYPPSGLNNPVAAFDDARALLAYRYNNNLNTLSTIGAPNNLFGTSGINAFSLDYIDGFSYGLGSLMTGFQLPVFDNDSTLIANRVPWVGADNTNHFFTHQELFNTSDTTMGLSVAQIAAGNFSQRLLNAGTNQWSGTTVSTYDRYTFYRLLSQLGTDSTPESGKMNLNYDNLNPYLNGFLNTNGGVAASTNFVAWQPLGFFTNAADRLLRAYTTQWRNSNPTNFATTFYAVNNFTNMIASQWTTNYLPFGIGNIPVLVSNQFVYSSAVNRLLQLAANIYDATTNNFGVNGNNHNYPSIFRPLFSRDGGGLGNNVFITGYELQTAPITEGNETISPDLAWPIDASVLAVTNTGTVVSNWAGNVYGVPWIIGAKKGFPNFNEFSLESAFQITRKLQYSRNTNSSPFQYASNQMYIMSITNFFGVECWNSYSNNYPGPVAILSRITIAMNLTNDATTFSLLPAGTPNPAIYTTVATIPTSWPGYGTVGSSFVTPFGTNAFVLWLTNSVYNYGPNNMGYNTLPGFIPTSMDPSNYINSGTPPLPHFGLLTTNRLQVAIIDYSRGASLGRIIDYVQLNGMDRSRDLNAEIADPYDYDMWGTNLSANGAPMGVVNQVQYSRYGGSLPSEDVGDSGVWTSAPGFNPSTPDAEQFYFNHFFAHNLTVTYVDPNTSRTYTSTYTATNFQAPWTPTRTRVQRLTWQANDPLVHYMISDLTDTIDDTNGQHIVDWTNWPAIFGLPNHRYMPWGGRPGSQINLNAPDFNAANAWNMTVKDPGVTNSDSWDFPTNKFPGVGWLGRVHRGTPWQTVYLKASDVLHLIQINGTPPNAVTNYIGTNTWTTWTGDMQLAYGQYFDADNSAPVQDRLLFDLFTTAFNDNATRGTLSVNVGPTNANLAAWSALFSGIVVPTNLVGGYTIINPAGPAGVPVPVGLPPGPNSPLCLGYLVQNGTNGINDIRARLPGGVFQHVGDILAVPALTERSPFLVGLNPNTQINDEMYEWLPQQTMSLLRCSDSPRYVIYCYGQALKPAPNGIYTGGDQFFGMVTNYQVVSEIATRAVVRFGSVLTNPPPTLITTFTNNYWTATPPMVTNNNAVIESFNILPPD